MQQNKQLIDNSLYTINNLSLKNNKQELIFLMYKQLFKGEKLNTDFMKYFENKENFDNKIVIILDHIKLEKKQIFQENLIHKEVIKNLQNIQFQYIYALTTQVDEYFLPSIGLIFQLQKTYQVDLKNSFILIQNDKIDKKDFKILQLFSFNSKLVLKTLNDQIIKIQSFKQPFKKVITDKKYYENLQEEIVQSLEKKKNLIFLVGAPGSGKSYLTQQRHFQNFERINNDTIQNVNKMNKIFTEKIKNEKSIIFDNTNPQKEKREFYLKLAKNQGYNIVCVYFDYPKELVLHLNYLRKFSTFKNKISQPVPRIAIYSYFKRVSQPTIQEGFNKIIKIDKFSPQFKEDEKQKYFECVFKQFIQINKN